MLTNGKNLSLGKKPSPSNFKVTTPKNTQAGVLVAGGIQRKKESVDSELARGRVSKFYWLVAIRSRVWGLVSLIV